MDSKSIKLEQTKLNWVQFEVLKFSNFYTLEETLVKNYISSCLFIDNEALY